MEFKISTDISSPVYQDAVAIRTTVFVKEQHVSPEREIDADEAKATYFVAYDNGLAVATARLLPEDYGYHVQRVAVLAPYRHHGVGKALLQELSEYAEARNAQELRLGAQVQAVGFYKALGYELTDRPEFLDAGIRHREMRLKLV
ncbi:GNAT family N-acetyltransferase [Lacticaseibacillus camelliae]|uniref:Acetyltransferase n=1 Tax=Lacticaseibacillus camelliae DSM 22697 = JCM 13995 TaxID=1423730 RepID=A0A0R2F9D2_9LACO|nr:GNAT family N-acetyltransferase [Lacticaseibacillus camelliae]KRN24867.1 acetyltransferase [Lacticaseibacillus camelliae DSM 22697 = JCM 13995]